MPRFCGFFGFSREEGATSLLEISLAVPNAIRMALNLPGDVILVNLFDHGDKDIDFVADSYGYGD